MKEDYYASRVVHPPQPILTRHWWFGLFFSNSTYQSRSLAINSKYSLDSICKFPLTLVSPYMHDIYEVHWHWYSKAICDLRNQGFSPIHWTIHIAFVSYEEMEVETTLDDWILHHDSKAWKIGVALNEGKPSEHSEHRIFPRWMCFGINFKNKIQ